MMLAAAILALATPPEAVRAAVEVRLTLMEAAALAGDADAWRASIASGDPTFAVEQAHFADDLRDHPPLELDLSIADDPPPSFADRVARFTVVMRYRAPTGHAAAGKAASWPAQFVFEDADGDGPLPEAWLYAGEQWSGVSGRGFEVRYLPGGEQAAKEILEAFPVAKAHDDEGFEITNDKHQVIKLYNDMEHLKATVYLTMPDEVLGGWNEPGESIKFMSNYTSGVPGWTWAMAHEYGHVATWELGPEAANTPWWVQEGAAELVAETFLPGSLEQLDRTIRSMAAAGTLPAFDQISDYQTTEAPLKIMAYYQGHHIMGYVTQRWGRRGRNDWVRAMARGATVDQATREVFALPFADLDAAWRATLKESPEPPVSGE